MNSQVDANELEKVRNELLKRVKEDKGFFCELVQNPEKAISGLKITDSNIKRELLAVTPDKVFERAFDPEKANAMNISCLAFSFGC